MRDVLVEVGWRFTANSFDSALTRIRKRRSVNGLSAYGAGKPSQSAHLENALSGDTTPPRSHSRDTSFSDALVASKGLVSRRRWK